MRIKVDIRNPLTELCSYCSEKFVEQSFAAGRTTSACPCRPEHRTPVQVFGFVNEFGLEAPVNSVIGDTQGGCTVLKSTQRLREPGLQDSHRAYIQLHRSQQCIRPCCSGAGCTQHAAQSHECTKSEWLVVSCVESLGQYR